MVKRYRSFLKELSKFPIEEQGVKIQEEFHSWKGNHDQVDDICVMGLRFNILLLLLFINP